MYYIIWNDIFSFFPVRFEMYISVAWYWNLYIIRWKCVWCSCAVGVILCSFYQFLDKVLFHHDNHKHQVCGYDTTLFIGQQHPITVYRTVFLGVRCSGVECHLCSFSQSLDEALFHHHNYTTMYYIIWNEIFPFFPDRFEMYISVAWFWILYIIMWKWVWCDTVGRSAAPHHILYDWELISGVRLVPLGSNLCSFFQFFEKVLFHHDNYKYQVYGYDTTLFIGYQHPIAVYRSGFGCALFWGWV